MQDEREVSYDERNKVTVRNDFIKAFYPADITATDLKLMRFVISQCRKNDTSFYEYSFSVSDIADRFHIDADNMYSAADIMVSRLFACSLKIGNEKKYKWKHIFSKAEYNSGIFTMQLDKDMESLCLQLQRNFTSIPLLPVLAMKNKRSIRIFELIYEKLKGGLPHADVAVSVYISINELKEITLKTEKSKSYEHMSYFRRRIIDPAVEEIEQAADWKIILSNVKSGREIKGLNFELWSRKSYEYIEDCKRKGIIPNKGNHEAEEDIQVPGQLNIFDIKWD